MNVLSFDVEDWYHCLDSEPGHWPDYQDRVVDSVHRVLDILEKTKTRATFFCLGCVAEQHPELVLDIHRQGHEIASHGYWHRFIYRQSADEFAAELKRSLTLLSSIIDHPILSFRAPYFSITRKSLWALDVLKTHRIRYDSSVFPVLNHRYGIPTAPRLPHRTTAGVLEVPLSTYPLGHINIPCSGGVYFRFLPYVISRRLLTRLNRRGEPIVFYLHPWELDACQPRIPMPMGLRVRHYWGLDKTGDKLIRLLQDFHFGPLCEVES